MTFEEALQKVYNDIMKMSPEEFALMLEKNKDGDYAKIYLATQQTYREVV